MLFAWFLVVLCWTVAEATIFVEVARATGWLSAVGLTLLTSIAGTLLLRVQGLAAMNRFLEGVDKGELPVETVLDGMGIFIAGALLVLPGFLSDGVGLVLFVPAVRRALIRWLFRQMPERRVRPTEAGGGPFRRGNSPRQEPLRRSDNVIDAEFETVQPETGADEKSPAEQEKEPKPAADRKSPWSKG
jgi:UPF0716 protein FxsA